MTNQTITLEQRLARVEEHNMAVLAAGQQEVQLPHENEQWWPSLIAEYGSEDALFNKVGIDRAVFEDVLSFVQDVAGERRGRRSGIGSNREKLLFLMTFMAKGVYALESMVMRFIKSRDHIREKAKAIARLFRDNVVDATVRYIDEHHEALPGASLIVDCMVCETQRPKKSFKEAKVYFSGKHYFYAQKKGVCVNIRSGTAAIISGGFPGCVHDIVVLRSQAREINETLNGRSILADLGYRGAIHDIPTLIVCTQQDQALRSRRVLVECFFGRLKRLWSIFSHMWTLGEEVFDVFFDIACGFTNVHILRHPLREVDAVFNKGTLNMIKKQQKERIEAKKVANETNRRKRQEELGPGDNHNPTHVRFV